MTAFDLRLAAAAAMLADHVGVVFFPTEWTWRAVGRLAFPLFAFLVANGCRHTSDLKGYVIRLMVLAAVSQAPYWAVGSLADPNFWGLNVFATLILGLTAIWAVERWPRAGWLGAVGAALAAEQLGADYGGYGVLLTLGCYLFYGQKVKLGVMLTGLTGAFYWRELVTGYWWRAVALGTIPLIGVYDGREGPKKFKWWFYGFYPAHLTVLYALKSALFP